MLTFSDKDTRKRTIWNVIDACRKRRWRHPGLRRLQIKEMGSDVMATADAPIRVDITAPTERTGQAGQRDPGDHKKDAGDFSARDDMDDGLPDYEIKVDPQRAQEVGLTPESIRSKPTTP